MFGAPESARCVRAGVDEGDCDGGLQQLHQRDQDAFELKRFGKLNACELKRFGKLNASFYSKGRYMFLLHFRRKVWNISYNFYASSAEAVGVFARDTHAVKDCVFTRHVFRIIKLSAVLQN